MNHNLLTASLLLYTKFVPNHRGKWKLLRWCIDAFDLNPKGAFVERRAGCKWKLIPADYIHQDLFWYGAKDTWEVHHAYHYLSKGAVFVDAGANFGYYAVQMAKRLGPTGQVYAFEPNPTTCALLKENICLNELQNVEVLECGLADRAGEAALSCRYDNSGAAAVVEGSGITLTTLDGFAAEKALDRLDFLKIDIEGFEERMLTGATKTLERFHPTILIELNPLALQKNGSSPKRIVDLLSGCGYQLFEIRRTRLIRLSTLPSGHGHINVIGRHGLCSVD